MRRPVVESALCLDPVERAVDSGEFVCGEPDELLGHAARDQAVGMVLAHEPAIGALDLVLAGIVGDAEHDIRIGGIRLEVTCADAAKLVRSEAENVGHALQELRFAGMEYAIRLGDLEQAIQDVFEDCWVAGEQPRDLSGIGLESGGIALRQVEHSTHIGFLLGGDAEESLECADLVGGNDAIRLGHFCRERNERDREDDVRIGAGPVDQEVTGQRAKHRSNRPGGDQAGRRAAQLSPDGHGRKL